MLLSTRPILLVEDDDVDVMTVKRAFKHLQVPNRLEVEPHGEDALTALTRKRESLPCLILLDLNMPRMGGLACLRLIKEQHALRTIPVVILTTSNDEHDKIKSFELGAAGYMIKPMGFDRFVDLLNTIIRYWTLSEIP